MVSKYKLTEGPIGQKIIKLSLTMMIGITSMVAFNVVDTIFIGMLGTNALAAMSFTLPVIMLMGTIALGLGLGATSVISHAIGSQDDGLVKRLTTDSLFLSLALVVIVAVIGLSIIDPLFKALGASGEILILVKQYITIWFFGVPFVVIPMVGNSAIRATGNTAIPSIIMLVAVVVNVILDPLFIFGIGPFPEMGLRGAALATVIARSTSFVISLLVLRFKLDMLSGKIPKMKQLLESWKKILYIGIPASTTQAIIPLAIGIITSLISGFGKEAVAAFGVSSRIEMLALSPLMALSAVMVPFIGQNVGAGKMDRIKKGIHFSWVFSLILGAIVFIIFLLFGKNIGFLFNPNSKTVSLIYLYLIIVSLAYGLQGVSMVSSSAFSALRKPFHSSTINIVKMFVLYIPLAWFGSEFWGLKGIFLGAAISYFLSGFIAMFWLNRTLIKIV